jgi:hypothetical protein
MARNAQAGSVGAKNGSLMPTPEWQERDDPQK